MQEPLFKCYGCENELGKVISMSNQMRFGCYGYDKKIIKCHRCNLIQLYPQWSKEELKSLYDKYSLKKDFDGYKPKINVNSYLTKYINKNDSILEIGCGNGDNVKWLSRKGYSVIGVDRDPTIQINGNILNCAFEAFDNNSKYDFIYAMHVLEHVEDPIGFLKHLIALLTPRGSFLLEIPNIEDPILSLYANQQYKKFVWYPYHLFFFNLETITNLLQTIDGIDVRVIRKQRYGLLNHLRWICSGKPGNLNFNIPLLDNIYKFILIHFFEVSDTLIILGNKKRF